MNFSIAILSWRSTRTLLNTLKSYEDTGLLDMAGEKLIYFQEISNSDRDIAKKYGLTPLGDNTNIGIGKAFTTLCNIASNDNVLFLENDWINIEGSERTLKQIEAGIQILDEGEADVVKYRHRFYPGNPLFTLQYKDREYDLPTHIFDCVHWRQDPDKDFSNMITSEEINGEKFYFCQSANANHTNNPTMYRRQFFLKHISPFSGDGIDLEGKVKQYWESGNFTVAHGHGLFSHHRIDR